MNIRIVQRVVGSSDLELGSVANSHVRRPFRIVVGIVIFAVVLICALVPAARTALLGATGRALVSCSQLQTADVIVVATEASGAGTLEAADLVHRGIATRVAVFADPPSLVDREFIRRELPYEDRAAISTRQLKELGVQNVEIIPRTEAGSENDGLVLPGWCEREHVRTLVLVTTADHSRRLRRILDRAMKQSETKVLIAPSRYSAFHFDRWWQSREGIRILAVELQKLLLDVVLHPFS